MQIIYNMSNESESMNLNNVYVNYKIGDWTYGNTLVRSFGEGTAFEIGKFCSIAAGVIILLGGKHRPDWITTYPFNILFPNANGFSGHPKSKSDVKIGNDVWIGRDALILSGIEIGDGAVIGVRSVVTKNVSPYSIVGGNPARHIRFRFDNEVIQEALKIWLWNWPISRIEEAFFYY
jgi:acetyltransferase-like isoleucine patch superfamily enzyme